MGQRGRVAGRAQLADSAHTIRTPAHAPSSRSCPITPAHVAHRVQVWGQRGMPRATVRAAGGGGRAPGGHLLRWAAKQLLTSMHVAKHDDVHHLPSSCPQMPCRTVTLARRCQFDSRPAPHVAVVVSALLQPSRQHSACPLVALPVAPGRQGVRNVVRLRVTRTGGCAALPPLTSPLAPPLT